MYLSPPRYPRYIITPKSQVYDPAMLGNLVRTKSYSICTHVSSENPPFRDATLHDSLGLFNDEYMLRSACQSAILLIFSRSLSRISLSSRAPYSQSTAGIIPRDANRASPFIHSSLMIDKLCRKARGGIAKPFVPPRLLPRAPPQASRRAENLQRRQ